MRALLFLIAGTAFAQPVTFTTTGSFSPITTQTVYELPSNTGTFRVEFLPAGPQTGETPTDRFGTANFGTLRVTHTGNPFLNLGNAVFNLTPIFLIVQTADGRSGVLQGTMNMVQISSDPRRVPRINFGNDSPVSLNGVHFSAESRFYDLLPPEGLTTVDIPVRAKLTRGGFVFGVPVVNMDLTPNITTTTRFPLSLPAGTAPETTLLFDFVSTGGSATEGTITVYLGSRPPTTFNATFRADGVPPATIPVQVRYLAPAGFTVEPELLTFRYQRGDPNPPTQYITVRASGASFTLSGWLYDGNWITVPGPTTVTPASPVQIPVIPNMTTKNVGFHSTTITLRTPDQQFSRRVRVGLEVYDQPGSLTVTTSGRGTVTLTPNLPSYPNGTRVVLTANPDRYYGFSGWTGSIPSSQNPLEITVNGPMNFHTDFALLGVSASCNMKLTPNLIYSPPEGDVGRIDVSSNCPWQVTGAPSWMRINTVGDSPATGSYFSYTVDPNFTTGPRNATFQVGGQTVTVQQATPGCASIYPETPGPIRAEGGIDNVAFSQIFGVSNCPEPQIRTASWIIPPFIPLPISGGFIAEANPYSLPRTAMIYSGGTRMPVIQEGRLAPPAFDDISIADSFAPHLHLLKSLGLAEACTANRFCPNQTVTRAEAARFIASAMLRTTAFPWSQTPAFSDVPPTHPHFRFVQKLAELGITQGCGNGRFCPDQNLNRGELAALLARAGARVTPTASLYPPAIQFFQDVAPGAPFFAPIQKMRQWGIANGCNTIDYCPNESVTRAQIAVMIVRALLTPY
ncbi:MAG: S-layer homology domain-containing protein [Bryobacterales bacterium]|nr:S-layer homology domain-containing protein [Bryobacterales bacterium]